VKESLNDEGELSIKNNQYLNNMLYEQRVYSIYVKNITIVNKNNIIVASSDEFTETKAIRLEYVDDYYLDGEFHIGKVYEREIDGENIRLVAAYLGIFDEEGTITGYVIEEIPTKTFERFQVEESLEEGGNIFITDGAGETITNSGIENDKYIPTQIELEEYYKQLDQIDWDNNSSGSFEHMIQGKKFVTYYSDIEYTRWKIIVRENLEIYREKTKTFKTLIIIFLLQFTVVLAAATFYLSRRLTKPMSKISQTVQRVCSEHDYSLRINNTMQDEFGVLSREIDGLLEYVEAVNKKEMKKQQILRAKADCDPLTGIYNKAAINTYIQTAFQEAKEEDGHIAVGFVDIDNFKEYNTIYGHQAGDLVIQFVADSLKNHFGDGIGRNGGDEFLFWLPNLEGREELKSRVSRFLAHLNEGFWVEGVDKKVSVPCSIGITIEKAIATNIMSLIQHADEAMYCTKESGKNGFYIVEK
jgi:diguanylate cyclase (GGDEF)-like protein